MWHRHSPRFFWWRPLRYLCDWSGLLPAKAKPPSVQTANLGNISLTEIASDPNSRPSPSSNKARQGGSNLETSVVTFSDHFALTLTRHSDAWWFHAQIISGHRREVVRLVTIHIVCRLLDPSPAALANWMERHGGGPAHDEPTKDVLEAYLLSDFDDDSNEPRLQGAVVEHLWACLAEDINGGWGVPICVPRDHFSVIDPGGDGLSLYDSDSPDLRFRLWESKRHDSITKSVTEVVSGASAQLKTRGAMYLARMSKPLQLNADPRIQQLAGKIVKLWTIRDASGGVGVSVGTTSTQALPDRPFRGLRRVFPYLETPQHREGIVIEVPDLAAFAADVRSEILKGIE